MLPKEFDYLLMYYEMKRLREDEHYSLRGVADYLGVNFRTVKKYLSMEPKEFEEFACSKFERASVLDPYKEYLIHTLQDHPDIPASVIHDRLKEHFVYLPDVHTKTVYNYVMKLRSEYGIAKVSMPSRQYLPIGDMAPGEQAQVDFGEKKLRCGTGGYIHVYFFTMVLSYSRYKFVLFGDKKFNSTSAVEAHEKAFEYIQGIPREIVYDQDCVFIHNENRGDYMMTDVFSRYVACRPFKVTFCRSADPESKGKIENVVKYIKQNFLYNRAFVNIEVLNAQVMDWLNRTGNRMIHNTTRKVPLEQWRQERSFFLVWHPVLTVSEEKGYKVHKTNSIKYKGNTYSLPFGTYRDEDYRVYISETDGSLVIRDSDGKTLATHLVPEGKGHTIVNTHHRRNTSIRLSEVREKVREFFRYSSSIDAFIAVIDRLYPRYVRDQLTVLLTCSEKAGLTQAEITLEFCLRNNVTSCNDFKVILEGASCERETISPPEIKPLGDASVRLISRLEPQKSDINEYEAIFNKQQNNLL